MSTTPLPIPDGVSFGRVRGRFLRVVKDTEADVDVLPNVIDYSSGSVTFTPEVSGPLSYDLSPELTIVPETIVVPIVPGAAFDVRLLATDSSNPSGWTWKVTVVLPGATTSSVSINVATDSDVWINEFFPVSRSTGTATARGPAGPAGPAGIPLRVRSDVASPYAFIGTAPVGTADADTGWLVSRIHLTAHDTHTATGAWDDRAVLPYES